MARMSAATEQKRPQAAPGVPDRLPTTMRASVLLAENTVEVQERPVPEAGPGEVLVRVGSVGVCGSDVHYFRHLRAGEFVVESPLVLGHEMGGTVVAVGAGVDASRIGERVAVDPQRPCHHCSQCLAGRYNLCPHMRFYATPPVDGAFAEYVTAPAEFAFPVADGLSDDAAALLEPLSVGIAAMRKARVVPGQRVLIAGAGPIGIITAQVARAFGAREVIVTDLVGPRRERALGFGATHAVDPRETDVTQLQVDAFIDASGAAPAITSGIRSVRGGGTAVLVGLGNPELSLPVSYIQDNEILLTGIFRYTDTWPLAAHLVASGQVDVDSLVTGRYDLGHAGDALDSDTDPNSLKSVVEPWH